MSVMSVRPFVTWYQQLIRLYDCREIRYRIFFAKSCRANISFMKICYVKAILCLGVNDFCSHFPHVMTDVGENRYRSHSCEFLADRLGEIHPYLRAYVKIPPHIFCIVRFGLNYAQETSTNICRVIVSFVKTVALKAALHLVS